MVDPRRTVLYRPFAGSSEWRLRLLEFPESECSVRCSSHITGVLSFYVRTGTYVQYCRTVPGTRPARKKKSAMTRIFNAHQQLHHEQRCRSRVRDSPRDVERSLIYYSRESRELFISLAWSYVVIAIIISSTKFIWLNSSCIFPHDHNSLKCFFAPNHIIYYYGRR